jgi:3-deoxy-D-manno-octulosonate 8-phosphate phosphatase (KDO 8-P phosphatase)
MLEAAGFSACPSDAAPQARKAAKVVLKNAGGRGAAREFIELVLKKNRLGERETRRPGGKH